MFRTTVSRLFSRTLAFRSNFFQAKPLRFASFFLASTVVYNFAHWKVAYTGSDPTLPEKFITTEDEDDGPADWSSDGKRIMTVCVTGAAGNLGQAFLPLLLNGGVFGPNVRIRIRLLDVPDKKEKLRGIAMELEDSIYPLLENIKYGSDPKKLFRHCDLVVCLAGAPRKRGSSRIDLLKTNGPIYQEHGQALNEVGKKDVRCVVVANPVNTLTSILQQNAPNVPAENFTCSTRLPQNRATAQIATKSNVVTDETQNIIAWGNHSNTIYPDVNNAKIEGKPLRSVIMDDKYLNNELVDAVQRRGDEILENRNHPSVLSGANALKDHLKDWWQGTEPTSWTSMGVVSDGAYNVPKGLVFSFPVKTKYFRYHIVKGLDLDEKSASRLQTAVNELNSEAKQATKFT